MQSRVCVISNKELDDWTSSTFCEAATSTDFLLGFMNKCKQYYKFVYQRCWYLNLLMFIIFLDQLKFNI